MHNIHSVMCIGGEMFPAQGVMSTPVCCLCGLVPKCRDACRCIQTGLSF